MSDATTPSGKPWWKKKRLYIPVAVVVVLAAIGSTGTKKDKETPVAVAATTEAQAAATAATTQATIPVPTTAKPLSKSKRRDREIESFLICKNFVTDRLKSPGSAKFRNPSQTDGEVVWVSTDDVTWTIQSSVDSENGFGALLRSNFVCTVQYRPEVEKWYLLDMQLTES
jgi:hypothetical protein